MVNFYRLIISLFLLICGSSAMADGGPFPVTPGQWDTSSCNQSVYPTHPYSSNSQVSSAWSCRPTSGGSRECGYLLNSAHYGWVDSFYSMCFQGKGPDSCPAGATKSGDTCTCAAGLRPVDGQCVAAPSCPEGQHEEGGACVPDNCKPNETRVNGLCVPEPECPAGQTRVNGVCKPNGCEKGKNLGIFDTQGEAATFYCEGGCQVRALPSTCVRYDGVLSCAGSGMQTGASCSGSSEGPGTTNPGNGPNDGGTGTGGTGTGSGGQPLPPPVTTPPDKDDEGKFTCPSGWKLAASGNACIQVNRPPDGDGNCPAASVKVSTTCVFTEPPGGGGDGDGDGDKSGFGGSCMAGFACDGDAIQCSIAKEQHARNCKLFDDQSAESKLYNENKNKSGNQTGDLPGNEAINIAGRISSVDALGGGTAGVADVNVTVWGQSITLPFSMINPYLEYLGYLLVAVSFLLAFRIVARG